MKMRDLLDLKFDSNSDKIDLKEILQALPNTPHSVAEQFYQDHGRKSEFQEKYADIHLDMLVWPELEIEARILIDVSINTRFKEWTEGASKRIARFNTDKWSCIDARKDVIEFWQNHATWKLSPILINGALLGSANRFHLIEGHTRMGILMGAIDRQIISPSSQHKAFVGNY